MSSAAIVSPAQKYLAMAEDDRKENKRRREQERRREFTEAYQELSGLLTEVDPYSSDAQRHTGELSEGKTRIELIHRSIAVIRRLHDENAHLRSKLEQETESARAEQRVSTESRLGRVGPCY